MTWVFHGDVFDNTTKGSARFLAKLGSSGYGLLILFNRMINYLLKSIGRERVSLSKAVMEGVTFAFRDCQRVLSDAGTSFGRILAVGGGSKSQLWLKLIATNLDTEIALPEDGDFGGALGAARLGLCAAEGADPAEVMTMPGIKQIIQPDASLRDAYTNQYARYRALYPAIEEARS